MNKKELQNIPYTVGILSVACKDGLPITPGNNINFLQKNNKKDAPIKTSLERDSDSYNANFLVQLLLINTANTAQIGHTPFKKKDNTSVFKSAGGSGALGEFIISSDYNVNCFATGGINISGNTIPVGGLLFKLWQAYFFIKTREELSSKSDASLNIFLPRSMMPYARLILNCIKQINPENLNSNLHLIGVHHVQEIPNLLSKIENPLIKTSIIFQELEGDYELGCQFPTQTLLNILINLYQDEHNLQRSFTLSNKQSLITEIIHLAISQKHQLNDFLCSMLEKGEYESFNFFLNFFVYYIINEDFKSYHPKNRATLTSLLEEFLI